MRLALIAFLCGISTVQLLPRLPPPIATMAVLVAALVLVRRHPALLAAIGGIAWGLWHAHLGLAARLPPIEDGAAFHLTGRIVGLPQARGPAVRFDFLLSELRRGEHLFPAVRRVALMDYRNELRAVPGATCAIYARLKAPHGLRNPAGQDLERWFFAAGIDASGYLIMHPANHCEASASDGRLERLRQRLGAAIANAVELPATAAVLRALAVGERAGMSDRQWQILQLTGTTHVISISGLHVSMVATFVYALVRTAWSLLPFLSRRCPASRVGVICGFTAALAYAVLAGLTVPTQRTLIMLACLLLQRWRGQHLLNPDGLWLALGIVLACDPLAVLTASFWLSFGAMGGLVAFSAVLRGGGFIRHGLGVHLWLSWLLTPLLGLLSAAIAWISPLSNLLAVPLVTWLVVPLLLFGILCALCGLPLAANCWRLAARIWEWTWTGLSLAADAAPQWYLPQAVDLPQALLALVGVLLLLVPVGRARYWFAPVLLSSLWWGEPRHPAMGEVTATVLDVGQGLSVVIQTRRHSLLYDAGPASRSGQDAGATVVVPNLRALGIATVDRMLISHADSDHAGGALSVIKRLPVSRLMLSPPHDWPAPVERCHAGISWVWDGVLFRILHPRAGATGSENDLSCVLKVQAGARSILLVGDIESATEAALVTGDESLTADVLLVPHHGSTSSSTPAFVAAVKPSVAVFPAGHGNRFGFPARAVRRRYTAIGARAFTTGESGAVRIELRAVGIDVTGWRESARRYWHAP